ncbi:hypothetical protein [Limnoglobus roseus]|uniref:hypothetical protein n=1 Tax=Limnoglobus roseus TaxID=2598579 RepID=UPI00143CFD1B|nr:hypothetical protein [Limnoglobus roseus]
MTNREFLGFATLFVLLFIVLALVMDREGHTAIYPARTVAVPEGELRWLNQ